jgi:uncharacterized delta-60 repeat protein
MALRLPPLGEAEGVRPYREATMKIRRHFLDVSFLLGLSLALLVSATAGSHAIGAPAGVSGHAAGAPRVIAAAGDLDADFGAGGKVTTSFGRDNDAAYAVAIQGDGKILAAGAAYTGSGYNFAVARYLTNGSLDAGFGAGGKTTTSFGYAGVENRAYALAVQGDGKIIAAGVGVIHVGDGYLEHLALVRYGVNGSLDAGFGLGGKVLTNFGCHESSGSAVAIQADGKIVAAGSSLCNTYDFAVARYLGDGSLDPAFGAGGLTTTDFGRDEGASSIALQGDGKLVVAGSSYSGAASDFALARYLANGSLDTGFGVGGKATTDFAGGADFGRAVALQSDGKIVVAGTGAIGGNRDFVLARYNSNGSLDTGFGAGGKVITPVRSGHDDGNALVIQPDGKIIVSGSSEDSRGRRDFALVRYSSNGSLDAGFGVGGKVTTDFHGYGDYSTALALQSDGKLAAAGVTAMSSFSDSYFALARYLGDAGTPPTSTRTATATPSRTPSATASPTGTRTATATPTRTLTIAPTTTRTPTRTLTPTAISGPRFYLPLVVRKR